MWPGSGFGNGPSAHDGFNQNDFPSSPFRGATGSPLVGQQGFAQNQQNSMQSDNVYSDAYNNSFQPEVGLYNQEAFTQNQFMNPLHQVRSVDLAQFTIRDHRSTNSANFSSLSSHLPRHLNTTYLSNRTRSRTRLLRN